MSLENGLLFLSAILLAGSVSFVLGRLATPKRQLGISHFLRLLIFTIIVFFAVPGMHGLADLVPLPDLVPIVVFVALIYIANLFSGFKEYLPALKEDRWENALWLVFILLSLMVFYNTILGWLFVRTLYP